MENVFKNAALFVNGTRTRRHVDIEWDDTTVNVRSRNGNKQIIESYSIEEFAGSDDQTQAWDILDVRGDRVRLVAQLGCGCSGQLRHYLLSSSYSGALGDRK